MKAPYIYPVYGLGELPQSFARLAEGRLGTTNGRRYQRTSLELELL